MLSRRNAASLENTGLVQLGRKHLWGRDAGKSQPGEGADPTEALGVSGAVCAWGLVGVWSGGVERAAALWCCDSL